MWRGPRGGGQGTGDRTAAEECGGRGGEECGGRGAKGVAAGGPKGGGRGTGGRNGGQRVWRPGGPKGEGKTQAHNFRAVSVGNARCKFAVVQW